MLRRAKHIVADNALINPVKLNDNSVNVAMTTPPMIGNNEKYTLEREREENSHNTGFHLMFLKLKFSFFLALNIIK